LEQSALCIFQPEEETSRNDELATIRNVWERNGLQAGEWELIAKHFNGNRLRKNILVKKRCEGIFLGGIGEE
jgi:hypothetical protein